MNIAYSEQGFSFVYIYNFMFQINHHVAWRFIASSILISPFILLVLWARGKFSPRLRSGLLGACFIGLALPFQRSALYLSDGLFLLVRHLAKSVLQVPALTGEVPYDVFEMISVVWLIGFGSFYAARRSVDRKALKLLREGKWKGCATYFYRFRSRIYLPPDFEMTYAPEEQEMLLAHEHQHIAQHDPFLYRLLEIVECLCWFNPLISIAVRHFQHERELLCDEQVTKRYPKQDYGRMLLKAAEQKLAAPTAAAGIVMEFGSLSERVSSLLEPAKTAGKWTAAAVIGVMGIEFVVGFMGFRPAYRSLDAYSSALVEDGLGIKKIAVFEIQDTGDSIRRMGDSIEGMEAFVTETEDGLIVDEAGLYGYARSLGVADDSSLFIRYIYSLRLDWGGVSIKYESLEFVLSELKTSEKRLDLPNDWDWFVFLTDVFL